MTTQAETEANSEGLSRRLILGGCGAAPVLMTPAIGFAAPSDADATARSLGDRWSKGIEDGDLAAVAACYALDMRIWNNVRRTFISGAEHVAVLPALFAKYRNRKYIDVRTDLLPGGFVRQHRLTGEQANGPIDMPVCYVARMRNGLFTQIEEYITVPAPPPLA